MGRRKIIRVDPEVVQSAVAQEEPSLKEKTARGLFWGGISNFVQQVIGMAFGIAIARILSPDDYGLVAMLAIFTAIANTVMDSGFTTALINKKTVKHRDYNAVFWFNVFAAIGMYVILFFVAPLIAHFYKQPILTDLSRILFLSFIIAAVGIAHNAYLLKKIMAKQRGIIDMAAVFCSGTVGLILALNGFAFWGLVAQQLTQISVAVLLRCYYSPWRPTLEFDFTPLKEMFGFGVKIFTTNIFYQVTGNLFPVVLGRYYGKTLTGYYAQGNKWSILSSSVVLTGFNNVAQPVLVEARDDIRRQLKIFRKMLRFGAFLTFPTLLGLAFISTGFLFKVRAWSTMYIRRFIYQRAHAYIAYYSQAKNIVLSYGLSSTAFFYGNTTDTDSLLSIREVLIGKPLLMDKRRRILHIGRLVKWKKVDLLIKAFSLIVERYRDSEL
ncbi:hypothetical protein T230_09175, partial [Tannerella sp. oral taxon BU063 isolate Cell 1/3]